MSNFCKECGLELPAGAQFCSQCGASVEASSPVVCKKCKAQNPRGARYCQECGSSLSRRSGTAPARHPKPQAGSRSASTLIAVGVAAVAVAAIYYYIGFVKPLENKTAAAPHQTQPTESLALNMPGSSSTPSQADIDAALSSAKNHPDDAEVQVHVGNVLFDAGKFEEAIPYYQKGIALNPKNPDAVVDLGVCYFNLEQYQKADELFREANRLDSRHVNALYNLGVVAIQLGKVDDLIHFWGILRDVAPNSPQAQRAVQILDEIHRNMDQNQQQNSGS